MQFPFNGLPIYTVLFCKAEDFFYEKRKKQCTLFQCHFSYGCFSFARRKNEKEKKIEIQISIRDLMSLKLSLWVFSQTKPLFGFIRMNELIPLFFRPLLFTFVFFLSIPFSRICQKYL